MADDDYAEMFGSETDDQNQQDKPSGGGLRKQLETALAELKAAKEKNVELETQVTRHTIDSVFSELDVPEKVRKFYTGEPDKDKILEWCRENADVFGISPGTGGDDKPEDKERNDQLRDVQTAGKVGFEGSDRSVDTIRSEVEGKIRSGKVSEADINAEINRLFGR